MASKGIDRGELAVPELEERGEHRLALLLRAAKLILDGREYLCVLRDASSGGVKLRLFHDLPRAERHGLELANGQCFALKPVWQRDGHIGCQFTTGPIDLRSLIDEASDFRRRQIRVRLDHAIRIEGGDGDQPASLIDISQHGARVETAPHLAIGREVHFSGDELPQLQARVRWRRRDSHGLVFQRAFRLDELAMLVARLHRFGCAAGSAPD